MARHVFPRKLWYIGAAIVLLLAVVLYQAVDPTWYALLTMFLQYNRYNIPLFSCPVLQI